VLPVPLESVDGFQTQAIHISVPRTQYPNISDPQEQGCVLVHQFFNSFYQPTLPAFIFSICKICVTLDCFIFECNTFCLGAWSRGNVRRRGEPTTWGAATATAKSATNFHSLPSPCCYNHKQCSHTAHTCQTNVCWSEVHSGVDVEHNIILAVEKLF